MRSCFHQVSCAVRPRPVGDSHRGHQDPLHDLFNEQNISRVHANQRLPQNHHRFPSARRTRRNRTSEVDCLLYSLCFGRQY